MADADQQVEAVLAIAILLAAATQAVLRRLDVRSSARISMAVAMIFAGVAHLLMPTPFLHTCRLGRRSPKQSSSPA